MRDSFFVTLDDAPSALRLVKIKIAKRQRPELDWLIFECDLKPCGRVEQTRDFQRWAKKQIARRKPVALFPDEN